MHRGCLQTSIHSMLTIDEAGPDTTRQVLEGEIKIKVFGVRPYPVFVPCMPTGTLHNVAQLSLPSQAECVVLESSMDGTCMNACHL